MQTYQIIGKLINFRNVEIYTAIHTQRKYLCGNKLLFVDVVCACARARVCQYSSYILFPFNSAQMFPRILITFELQSFALCALTSLVLFVIFLCVCVCAISSTTPIHILHLSFSLSLQHTLSFAVFMIVDCFCFVHLVNPIH